MFASWRLGRFSGIDLFVHWTFWLLPITMILFRSEETNATSLLFNLGLIFTMFGCVALHEFGHALTARGFGIATRDITLYPIGGVASLERISEKPFEEFCIAVAGPLVNVVIAVGLWVFRRVALLGGVFGPESIPDHFMFSVIVMNGMLVAFNLLPAFPMDGGRVLRAILAYRMGYLPATRMAVAVGGFMALLFGIVGIFVIHHLMLALIGLFIYWAGQQELRVLEYRERLRRQGPAMPVSPFVWTDSGSDRWAYSGPMGNQTFIWDPENRRWVDEDQSRPTPTAGNR